MRNATVSRSTTTTKSAAATKTPAKKAPVKKTVAKATIESTPGAVVMADTKNICTPERRHAMISDAAYYLSEKTGFNPALTHECWLQAEKQIDDGMLGL